MTIKYLKKAPLHSRSDDTKTQQIVRDILHDIENGGDEKALEYASKFDKYEGEVILSKGAIEAAAELVPEKMKQDIEFAHSNVERFARAQKSTVANFETEVVPGLIAGQKAIPVNAAGCYIPGGRYSHIASAIMTVTTAKVAGCENIIACSPPRPVVGVAPAIIYAAHICGADKILAMGGVQGIAAMTFGLFGLPKANILVGPGNQFVTSAKAYAQKKGVAIDMLAGPSELFVVADNTANPQFIAADLISQAEHGADSQVILASDSETLLRKVNDICIDLIKSLPREKIAKKSLSKSRLVLMSSIENCIELSNFYAPEHLIIACNNARTLRSKISNAGSVFLGNFSCESAGDYASGTNHALPTGGTAVAQSGVSVESFQKKISFQTVSKEGLENLGPSIKAMANAEGLQGHALAVDIRLENKS